MSLIGFYILTFEKKVKVNCVIILFYCFGDKHSMNLKQPVWLKDVQYNLSNLCCLPTEKCVANLHDKSRSKWYRSHREVLGLLNFVNLPVERLVSLQLKIVGEH